MIRKGYAPEAAETLPDHGTRPGPPGARQSWAARSRISRAGLPLAWLAVSDLGRNAPGTGNPP